LGAQAAENAFDKVLVVEDDHVLRRALVRGLRAWGMETLEAADLKAARRMLRCEPDLVVTDVRLPDGTGHEVARRAARLHSPPFVVAMSGEATAAEAFELARASVRIYLEKPFTVDELRDRIQAHQSQGAASEPLPWDQAIPRNMRAALLAALQRVAQERSLTPRELDVLQLALAGAARAALPAALGVSKNTCKTLVRGALRKCGLERLAQVSAFVLARVVWDASTE
jgi:DNA-binding NarL/FixJ family response regulator